MEQLNVAIADDNERILDMLEEVINMDKELHVVGKAKNGEEMYRIIKNKQPDVVLLDLIMPKMDGLTVMDHVISYGSEKVSDNIEPGGTGDPPCHRSRMEQRETGYVG